MQFIWEVTPGGRSERESAEREIGKEEKLGKGALQSEVTPL